MTDPMVSDDGSSEVVRRIAARAVAKRTAGYADEVRRLLDAGREVMADAGTSSRPRVADIVAAAGLSNDAFYRHFRSKDDLVGAILQDGTERLRGYLAHQMDKETQARGRLARWVAGILAQADAGSAQTTRAVMWNVGNINAESMTTPPSVTAHLATLLHDSLRELGSAQPEFDARLVAHATIGMLSDCLWQQTIPTSDDVDRIVAACLGLVVRE
ncbi:helix-turn-helix domain-containing protein [Gordonia sp. CPCC 206044]|uniref:TetR/AcrR family transcriptional regulator n=1 Tax=Gordonia sp. CPCC 206044 TaxID=3140793 RepID=UPI003AF3A33E